VIFIDGEYLRKIYKNSGLAPDIPVLIRKILKKLGIEERELLRVYYYSSPPYCSSTPTPKEKERYKKWQRFINFLEKQNSLEIKLGRVEKRYWDGNIGYEQKMVDVLLSIDLVQLSAKSLIDTAILDCFAPFHKNFNKNLQDRPLPVPRLNFTPLARIPSP